MKPYCAAKRTYPTRRVAEAAKRDLARDEHPAKAATLRAFYCRFHGAWHIGHRRAVATDTYWAGHTDCVRTIMLLRGLREELITDYGTTEQPDDWRGIRALTGAIRSLSRSV